MTIQPGRFYKTRDGRKARIYAVDGPEPRSVHGSIRHNGNCVLNAWHDDGREEDHPGMSSPLDLISEWTESEGKKKVLMLGCTNCPFTCEHGQTWEHDCVEQQIAEDNAEMMSEPKRQNWEYLCSHEPDVSDLRDVGNNGWELVCQYKGDLLIFKRPKS